MIFRFWQGEVIAMFPAEPAGLEKHVCSSYMHVGQHGSADGRMIIRESRPATPDEYASLKAELESYPYEYRLKVYQRWSTRFDQARCLEVDRWRIQIELDAHQTLRYHPNEVVFKNQRTGHDHWNDSVNFSIVESFEQVFALMQRHDLAHWR